MSIDSRAILDDVFARLERAWNEADGAGFVAAFTDDADFVDIRGVHHHGAEAIGGGHQAILDTIYKGSTVEYRVVSADVLAEGCLLGRVEARLDAPSGPMQGTNHSILTTVAVADGNTWKVRVFHNTLVTG